MEHEINPKEMDYLYVLKALRELPFNVGRKLLIDFLQGNFDNASIERNNLGKLKNFGSMAYEKAELNSMIDSLLINGMMSYDALKNNNFVKVLALTSKGAQELENPLLYKRKLGFNFNAKETIITDEDRLMFENFDFFLKNYNDDQKKAIICRNASMLCIAGAGSGKTSVLTKRIEFLVKFQPVDPAKILAITFTRKARAEMKARLSGYPYCEGVWIETFNSFCEKMLNRHNDLAYSQPAKVMGYSDKIRVMKIALSGIGMTMENALERYFTLGQRKGKSREELANVFMNDCFFILDYYKSKNNILEDFSKDADPENAGTAKMVHRICAFIDSYMKRHGLRDYADQLLDAIRLFKGHKEIVPCFEHIMIDEYQDVNSTQQEMVEILNPKNLFCVGDPRQSIFGWRGSNIKHILNFEEKYPGCEIVTLQKNYRSTGHIVNLLNSSIRHMRLPDLKSSREGNKDAKLLSFDTEEAEFEFIMQRILASDIKRSEIFVLARTNRQLDELSNLLKLRGIKHVLKKDDVRNDMAAKENEVTLSTIHSIKGMEATMVFVMGCVNNNFPCRASDHPIIDMVKTDDYDKEEEERRLFYVAMSRAKETLYLSYHGKNLTSFITHEMRKAMEEKSIRIQPMQNYKINKSDGGNLLKKLKEWRRDICQRNNIAPYMVMHDRTLLELVQKKPAQVSELQEIHGFGPVKIMKYGSEIIGLINS